MSHLPTTPTHDLTQQRSETDPVRTHRLDDAPMRSKIALMVVTGVLVGMLIHLISARLNNSIILGRQVPSEILAMIGFLVSGSTLILIGQWWIATPYDRLVKQIDKVAERRKIDDLSALPLTRRDEAGRIARAMHRVTTVAIRDGQEARQLRKTIDKRVQEETQRSTAQLRRLALRDPLTELGNRRFLDEQLPRLIEAAEESGTEVSAMVIDMDGFKQVNDQLGHDAGDELLVLTAGLLKACTRHDDMTVRLGGDEFVVLMPGCDRQRAIDLSNSIRMLFRQQAKSLLSRANLNADLSAGVSSLTADKITDAAALIKLADQRLYQAKRSGKGRTC
ncbi:MAG: GGDEF domain-containing protein [Phycisphaeraceae bacterium]